MAWIGQGIAFASLVAAAVYLEVTGYESRGVWLLIVIWALFMDWHPSGDKDDG